MENMTASGQMIALCRAALCGEDTLPFDRPSEERLVELYALSTHHDMAHLVSYALYRQGWLDGTSEVGGKFQRAQMLAVFRYERQKAVLEETCAALEQAGFLHLPLKGSVIRSLYPEPWMRTSADIDVLVKGEDAERAASHLIDTLGYLHQDIDGRHDISLYTPSGVHIELHFDLIEDGRVTTADKELSDVWSATHPVEGTTYRRAMNDDMFYFYHVAHMAKHVAGGGCGVRTFADLWLLNHRVESDAVSRRVRVDRAGLNTFERVVHTVSEMWFSLAEGDDLAHRMATYTLRGGMFGDALNKVAINHAKGKRGLRYVFSRIFMPYEYLCRSYPALRGRKYLTFFYQIHRLVRGVFGGRFRAGVRELRINRTMDQAQADATAQLLCELNIAPPEKSKEE